MNCITRNEMKFGDYIIPARTKATVIYKPMYREANLPGMQLSLAISLFDIHADRKIGVPISTIQINNELEQRQFGPTNSQMTGIVIHTHGDRVFLDTGDQFYADATLSKWQLERIFDGNIPENIEQPQYSKDYLLPSVVEYLENEFTQWVKKNCKFRKLTKRDIENGEGFDGAEPGDRTLSDEGLERFGEKQLEYQNRLETTGFTYDFKGGLIWD